MKYKLILFSFVFLSAFSIHAETHLVTASNVISDMNPDFWVTETSLVVEDNIPTILVEFTGMCATQVVNQCNVKKHGNHYDFQPLSPYHHHGPSQMKGHYHSQKNEHSPHNSCYYAPKLLCEHQEGRYPLPSDKVIYDGEKRWKYIGDGEYLTIARNDRASIFWLFREWHLRETVELNVTPNGYQSITLTIHSP